MDRDGPRRKSPAFVIDISTEQLEEVAGEDIALKRKRKQL